MGRFRSIVGRRFSRVVVLRLHGRDKRRQLLWLYRCDCGKEKHARASDLIRGTVKSCGCLKTEKTIERNRMRCGPAHPWYKHGKPWTSVMRAYGGARNRCTNPNAQAWALYGGRGIKFLFSSIEQWIDELGPKPSPRHSVDRIDNDGNYEPGNIRWATYSEQNHNQGRHLIGRVRKIVERAIW